MRTACQSLVLMAFADRHHGPIVCAHDQIAAKKFGQSFHGFAAEVALHASNAVAGEVANNATAAVKDFLAVVNQPVADKGRHAALLSAMRGMSTKDWFHLVSFKQAEVRGPRWLCLFVTFKAIDATKAKSSGEAPLPDVSPLHSSLVCEAADWP